MEIVFNFRSFMFQKKWERILVKFMLPVGPFYKDICSFFPQMKTIFLSRHPLEMLNSWYKLSQGPLTLALFT